MTTPELPEIPIAVFERRRATALAGLGGGAMVLPAAPLQYASRDTERPYAPDRELYYLTGATEPGTVAVLVGGAEPRFELFVRERDADAERWAGARLGPEGASERFAPDACHPLGELALRLPDLLSGADRIHFRLGRGDVVETLVLDALVRARARGARAGRGPRGITDPGEILDELRLRKGEAELARMRRAAEISVRGHEAAAASIGPGVGEWVVEATVDASFRSAGAAGPGYETIVGSGANACVLHYVGKDSTIAEGDLVLVDAGAEYGLYHGDVTRTYPASGRFSDLQRAVYDVVEAARRAAIGRVAPGARIGDVHDAAVSALAEGLSGLGVLRGPLEDSIDTGAHKAYFPHQTSHWLGLDVHDPGDYARDGASRVLEPGMVFTVEPGLYFSAAATGDEPTRFDGIGVRIEDDVLVTREGCEVLTLELPTSAEDVESLVLSRR